MKIENYVFLVVICCFLGSCKKETLSSEVSACDVKDPVNNLSWLKDKLAEDERTSDLVAVRVFEFEGETYFDWAHLMMSCMSCVVYDCQGNRLEAGTIYEENYSDFVEASRGPSSKIIWQGKETM